MTLNSNNSQHLESTRYYALHLLFRDPLSSSTSCNVDVCSQFRHERGPIAFLSHTASECQKQDSNPGLSDSKACIHGITSAAVALPQGRQGHRGVRLFAEPLLGDQGRSLAVSVVHEECLGWENIYF